MANYLVPNATYPTIQSVLNIVQPGDVVEILPGVYDESLYLNQDNVSILAATKEGQAVNNDQVIFYNDKEQITGLTICANGVSVQGLIFINYFSGIVSTGDSNAFIYDILQGCQIGMSFSGNNNRLISCVEIENKELGLSFSGNRNLIITNRCEDNGRGIVVISNDSQNNIFYKCVVTNNKGFNIRLSEQYTDNTIFLGNTISNSEYGLLINSGRAAVIGNLITNHYNVGLSYKDDTGIILENNLNGNKIGMYLLTSQSIMAANVVQEGNGTGILLTGAENYIFQNIVTNYVDTGLVVNGCKNQICNNILTANGINVLINGQGNYLNCNCKYCDVPTEVKDENYYGLLDIFDMKISKFCKNKESCK